MLIKRVNSLFLLIIIFSLTASCSLFQKENELKKELPAVTLESLVEIKELPKLDSYGFEEGKYAISEGRVRRNESLYIILRDLDVSPQTIKQIEDKSRGIYRTNRIQAGQRYLAYAEENNAVNRLILHDNVLEYVVFDWSEGVNVQKGRKAITTKVVETSGVITSSLYMSLLENNIDPLLGNRLSEIFGWQIDFFRIYENDSYKVIYEQQYVDGEPFGVGKVLAAEFNHRSEVYDAFFFETEDRAGYFDSEGKGVQKALLKAPFKYSQRVSSGFSHNRFHPVLKTRRPHYGVDYAAPLGTPVISVGEGEIVEARYRGANGNIVKIRHNSTYTTAYLHLNGFASGIRPGVRVKQGQVIGYVGKTGRVTGVHLDYRVYKNGQPVNPLKVKLPPSKSISEQYLTQFRNLVVRYKFEMDQIGSDYLASLN
jgi:murein DD-endopeptidase MepM/ murein hydrolase activator NlpD